MVEDMTDENTYGSTALRFQTAEILAKVRSGKTITITQNGKPVAEMIPLRDDRGTDRKDET